MREDRSVARPADRRLHVRERAARPALRHQGRRWSRFRRVPRDDEARKGLLGHGSILTVTSYPNRTSPVLRGKWILEQPARDAAPAAAAERAGAGRRSANSRGPMREQMEQHRANPTCANCHRMIDPLGFALENFDGVGAWRPRRTARDRRVRRAGGRDACGRRRWRCARRCCAGPNIRRDDDREAADVCAGPGPHHSDMPAVRRFVATPPHNTTGSHRSSRCG